MNRARKAMVGMMMAGLMMAGMAFAQSPQEPLEEVITIETFFPAPWAEFDEMRLYPTIREASYCDNDRIGYMYYDDAGTGATQEDDAVKVCKGTLLGWQELGGEKLWTASGNDIYNTNTGNVGIGTASPDETLHVNGTIKMVDGNQADGFVLTSDANGVGTWQADGGIQYIHWGGTSCALGYTQIYTGYITGLTNVDDASRMFSGPICYDGMVTTDPNPGHIMAAVQGKYNEPGNTSVGRITCGMCIKGKGCYTHWGGSSCAVGYAPVINGKITTFGNPEDNPRFLSGAVCADFTIGTNPNPGYGSVLAQGHYNEPISAESHDCVVCCP